MKKSNQFFLEKCSNIKLVLSDIDGVLTDGGMYYSKEGESFKKFNTRDGMGVELLRNNDIPTILITKENSDSSRKRAQKIGAEIFEGVLDKKTVALKLVKKHKIKNHNLAYIGDDINDLELLKIVGFSSTPSNAIESVKETVDYVCKSDGGNGAFREIADLILESKLNYN
jgi:3-deoxy-D-manno-octulosonate 8-phosphate phosphatase (KDO 8-P phosphatase)